MDRKYRIVRATDFKRVRQTGKSTAHPLVVLVSAGGQADRPRAGIVTSKGVGKAVQRNRARRQLRAILRPIMPSLKSPVDFLVIARAPIVNARFSDIRNAVMEVLTRAKLLSKNDDIS